MKNTWAFLQKIHELSFEKSMIWVSAMNLLPDTYTVVVFLTAFLFDLKDTSLYIGK